MNGNNRRASYDTIHFDSFGAEHVKKKNKKTDSKEKNSNKFL